MGPTPEGRQRFPVRRTMKHNRTDARRDLSLGEVHLVASLGKDAGGLSASTIGRLKEAWSEEHTRWSKRDLSAKRYVYFWVDGIHVQARLENDAQCLLVIATPSAGCSRSPTVENRDGETLATAAALIRFAAESGDERQNA